jgi:hypothetical protein
MYRIVTDDRSMSAYTVISEATSATPDPFPDYFSTYNLFGETDNSSFMQEADCRPLDEKNASVWLAKAVWSPIKGTESTDNHTSREDPLSRPVRYGLEWEEISIPVEKGWNQVELSGLSRSVNTFGPIQNAAGQEPSSPILKTKRIPVIVAKKNYASLGTINAIEQTYGDGLNSDTFYGYSAGECLFRGINASEQKYEGGTAYYEGSIRIACQKGGWDYEMVNRGWKYLDNGELKECTVSDKDGNKVPVSEPANLELDGSQTPDGAIGTVIPWRHRPLVAFSGLGI